MSNLYRRALFATCVFAATCAVDFGVRAAGPFDGTYAGESPVAGSVSPSCKDYHMTVVVKDGHFNTVVLTIPFSVDVSADGAFSATALRPGGRGGVGTMTGKISGGTMTMDYHAADCAHHAVLTRT